MCVKPVGACLLSGLSCSVPPLQGFGTDHYLDATEQDGERRLCLPLEGQDRFLCREVALWPPSELSSGKTPVLSVSVNPPPGPTEDGGERVLPEG